MILPKEHSFLTSFFSEGNALNWPDIYNKRMSPDRLDKFSPWIALLLEGKHPIVLPRVKPGSQIVWYGLAKTEKQLGELRELLQAHIGPSYSDFDGILVEMDSGDPIERSIINYFNGQAFRFSSGKDQSKKNINKIFSLLLTMMHQMQNTPPLLSSQIRPQGRILRDINFALHRQAPEQALHYLDELKLGGGIGYQNELFIELRCIAVSGNWQEIMNHPDLLQVLDLPRPALLTDILLQAVYSQLLLSFEVNDDLPGLIKQFETLVYKRMTGLFKTLNKAKSWSAAKIWLLWLLHDDEPNKEKAKWLISDLNTESEPDKHFLDQIMAKFPQESVSITAKEDDNDWKVLQLKSDEDPVWVLKHIAHMKIDTPLIALALKCAWAIYSTKAAQQCFDLVNELEKEKVAELLRNNIFKRYYEEVEKLLPKSISVISTWNDWLLEVTSTPSWPVAAQLAEEGAEIWGEDAIDVKVFRQQISQLENTNSGQTSQQVRFVTPYLLNWYGRHRNNIKMDLVWFDLLELLSLDDQYSSEDMFLAYDLIKEYLNGTISLESYCELLDVIEILLDYIGSENINQCLDILELLTGNNCPNKKSLHALFNSSYAKFCANPMRYQHHEWQLLLLLAKEAGLNLTQPDVVKTTKSIEDKQNNTNLNGMKLGIYTLTESVGLRVKKDLEELFPKINVKLNHDKVATTSLLSLAKNVDLFVFAWRSSAHQAYYAIKGARNNKPLLLPEGKGSSSMLRCLLEYEV